MSVDQRTTERRKDVVETGPGWEREWRDAAVIDRADSPRHGLLAALVVAAAAVAGLLPATFPFSPGYGPGDTTMQVVAAAVAALVCVGVVPLASAIGDAIRRHGVLLFSVATLSAGAAAIHFAAAKDHFVLALGCIALLVRRRRRGAVSRRTALVFALTLAVMIVTAAALLSAVGVGSPVITPSA